MFVYLSRFIQLHEMANELLFTSLEPQWKKTMNPSSASMQNLWSHATDFVYIDKICGPVPLISHLYGQKLIQCLLKATTGLSLMF